MAIFEEKYGETVRLVRVGDFSKELCGGIHVRATGEIGLFKILSESSVAAGMRRIEAVTGEEAFRYLQELEDLITGLEKSLSVSRKDLPARIDKLLAHNEGSKKRTRTFGRSDWVAPRPKLPSSNRSRAFPLRSDGRWPGDGRAERHRR